MTNCQCGGEYCDASLSEAPSDLVKKATLQHANVMEELGFVVNKAESPDEVDEERGDVADPDHELEPEGGGQPDDEDETMEKDHDCPEHEGDCPPNCPNAGKGDELDDSDVVPDEQDKADVSEELEENTEDDPSDPDDVPEALEKAMRRIDKILGTGDERTDLEKRLDKLEKESPPDADHGKKEGRGLSIGTPAYPRGSRTHGDISEDAAINSDEGYNELADYPQNSDRLADAPGRTPSVDADETGRQAGWFQRAEELNSHIEQLAKDLGGADENDDLPDQSGMRVPGYQDELHTVADHYDMGPEDVHELLHDLGEPEHDTDEEMLGKDEEDVRDDVAHLADIYDLTPGGLMEVLAEAAEGNDEPDDGGVVPDEEEVMKPAPEGVNEDEYDRCVEQVKEEDTAENAHAVCAEQLGKTTHPSGHVQDVELHKLAMAEDGFVNIYTYKCPTCAEIQNKEYEDASSYFKSVQRGLQTGQLPIAGPHPNDRHRLRNEYDYFRQELLMAE